MDSSPTLQDFVLNLIYDPSARSAFELDPEATLQHAGLGDITAADVQQVIPLVIDSAPVYGITGLAGVDDITTGVANLDVAGAVAHLQTITSQVAVMPNQVLGDVNNTVAGVNATVIGVTGDNVVLSGNTLGLGGNALGLSDFGNVGGIAGVGGLGLDHLSAVHDPALDLDSTVVAPVEGATADVTPTVDHVLPGDVLGGAAGLGAGPLGVLDSGLGTVTSLPSSIGLDHSTGLDVGGVHGATSSIGSLIKPDLGENLSHDPVQDLHHTVTSGVGDAGHAVTGVVGGLTHPDEQDSGHGLLGDVTGLHF